MESRSGLSRNATRWLMAKAEAYLKALVVTPEDARLLGESERFVPIIKKRKIFEGDTLCNFCRVVDFSTLRGEDDAEGEYDLGFVEEIIHNEKCALCRLVRGSLQLHWSSYPTRTITGDLVRCHLFIPGPENGHGRREIVISPLVVEDELPDGVYRSGQRQSLVLLVDDLKLVRPDIQQKNSSLGRVVPPEFDIGFLRQTFCECVKEHGIGCAWPKLLQVPKGTARQSPLIEAKSYSRNLRVIDVEAKNVITADAECRYVALSYVWGTVDSIRLQRDSREELASIGALARAKVSRTVRDAMKLTVLLGERYLWIDALCIVQDDEQDKLIQIEQMDVIYTNSILTLVAASGTDAEAGLPGLEPETRRPNQHIESIGGLRLVANGPELRQVMASLRWNARGWTFQELALSKRVLCFTPHQCYFLCNAGVQSEDTTLEYPAGPNVFSQEPLDVFQLNTRAGLWQCYKEIVNGFSSRSFTCENDVNDGIDGLLNLLSTSEDEAFICGLPETLLDSALLWMPDGPMHERAKHRNGEAFPSWSWTGWVGPVHYPFYMNPSQEHDIHSFITKWVIETSDENHELFVDPRYIKSGSASSESSYMTGTTLTYSNPHFTPSPWRKRLKREYLSNANVGSLPNYTSVNSLRPRIQTGVLSFATRLASFIIYNNPDHPPAIATAAGSPHRRPCAIVHQSDRRPKRPSVFSWVGTVFIEISHAETLPLISQGNFIVLSSTNTSMLPWWLLRDRERPDNGLIYSEDRFGPLPEASEGVAAGRQQEHLLYNVMWVKWGLEYTSRLGVGQIHRDGWELADNIIRKIRLR
ncbi:HET-domain-containing protein [Polychaeton citri CBS 116435]|uniref:HET-domain-containing protein n=1 Tax=Polychaeton citri CBS 116435 TaxID=1314669 RepID=A0A9P4Q3M9_9PEZI|nr:HET-domain-containing protein [Polychaeton citri CBS 116435]